MTWIEQAQRNRDGRLWLELSELDIADWATVVSIDECPAQIEGQGRLVTGRFEHSSAEVLNLYVEGERTPIGTTASHPFWSQDRQAFVSAELLTATERLRLADGRTAAVIRIEQLPGTQSVYNLEVDGEHVYHVGLNGVLVHNMCAPKGIGFALGTAHTALDGMNKGGGHAIKHLVKDGTIPNVGSLATKVAEFRRIVVPILENPLKSFNGWVGVTKARVFVGEVNGRKLAVFVATDGPFKGKVISSFFPNAQKLAEWGF